MALEVFKELRERKAELDRQRRRQVERARQEAELAQRHYLLVRPENRLVADALEQQWNEKLSQLARVEEAVRSGLQGWTGSRYSTHCFESRSWPWPSDLPSGCGQGSPYFGTRPCKRMLRLLVEDVTLIRDRKVILTSAIRWKGGATTELERPATPVASERFRTPADIVEQVRALATEQTTKEIARTLNQRGLRSGRGNKFTRLSIKAIRRTYQIDSLYDHLPQTGMVDDRRRLPRSSRFTTRRPRTTQSPAFSKPVASTTKMRYYSLPSQDHFRRRSKSKRL